jgi:hypothetical protein
MTLRRWEFPSCVSLLSRPSRAFVPPVETEPIATVQPRHKAEVTTHLPTKAEFQDIERRWLSLARSYEFSEQLARFTHEVKRNMRKR